MNRKKNILTLFCLALIGFFSSCSGDKPIDSVRTDSTHDTMSAQPVNDSLRNKFKKLVSAMPVPFDMLQQFSGAHLPFKGELLNKPERVSSYNQADQQSLNLGIYGADLAYMISQNKLGESAPYLKCVHQLSDLIVVPTAFDIKMMQRWDANQDQQDSLGTLLERSYKKIDSTLQGNDRLILATLVITGGWTEGIYLTTQHIGDEKQNEKNKVLFDMLSMQHQDVQNISDLLGSFPQDKTCSELHGDFEKLKTLFPGPNVSADEFSVQLKDLRESIAEIRNHLISVQ